MRFARLALEVSQVVLPPQRTKFSKRVFAQPQLLAVLCLMRYEDWTFREAEVRLSEHSELRSALHLLDCPASLVPEGMRQTGMMKGLAKTGPNGRLVFRQKPARRGARAQLKM